MKKILTWIGIVVLVVGGGILTFWPVDHWRLYDANLRPLVMTNAESYCAGFQGLQSGFKSPDPLWEDCMETTSRDNTEPSVAKAPKWMCDGIIAAGWPGGSTACLAILEQNQFWLLVGGGLTSEWNDAHPRPKPIDEGVLDPDSVRENRSADVTVPNYSQPKPTEEEETTDE